MDFGTPHENPPGPAKTVRDELCGDHDDIELTQTMLSTAASSQQYYSIKGARS
jgi:hypothetical protein